MTDRDFYLFDECVARNLYFIVPLRRQATTQMALKKTKYFKTQNTDTTSHLACENIEITLK